MDLIRQNFKKHFTLLPGLLNGMTVDQQKGFCFVDSGLPCDTFNIAFIQNGKDIEMDALEKLTNHFVDQNFPFCVWAEDDRQTNDLLTQAGYQIAAEDITMILDLAQFDDSVYKSKETVQVERPEQLNETARVIAENWTPADQNVIDFYQMTGEQLDLKKLDTYFFNLHADQQVVGCVELCLTDHMTAGIYGLAVLEQYRKRGFGHSLMVHALCFAKGLDLQHVILQASEDGLGLYKRLGFQTVGKFQEWQLVQ